MYKRQVPAGYHLRDVSLEFPLRHSDGRCSCRPDGGKCRGVQTVRTGRLYEMCIRDRLDAVPDELGSGFPASGQAYPVSYTHLLAGNNIFNCRKRDSQALRRRALRATSPRRLRDAVAGSGTLAVSPEIARALNVGVWAEPGAVSYTHLALASNRVTP